MACAPAVTFNYAAWQAMFPELATVSEANTTGYFQRATLICHNRLGPVSTVNALTTLLYLLVAFFAKIYAPTTQGGQGGNAPVGRISGASEGSVSVQFENQYPPGSAQFYQQNIYGAEYWNATAIYRTFRYRSGVVAVDPIFSQAWLYPQEPYQ